jgi:hypothetical protein
MDAPLKQWAILVWVRVLDTLGLAVRFRQRPASTQNVEDNAALVFRLLFLRLGGRWRVLAFLITRNLQALFNLTEATGDCRDLGFHKCTVRSVRSQPLLHGVI